MAKRTPKDEAEHKRIIDELMNEEPPPGVTRELLTTEDGHQFVFEYEGSLDDVVRRYLQSLIEHEKEWGPPKPRPKDGDEG